MTPPADHRRLGIVVLGIVIFRHLDGQTLILVPQVFPFQGIGIILHMTGDENLPAFLVHHCIHPGLLRGGENLQSGNLLNVRPIHGGMPGMWNPEHIIEAPQQNRPLVVSVMGIDAEQLPGQRMLLNAIVVVKSRLGSPADVEGGMDMGFAPLHNPAQLRPVVHFLKGHLLHRRTSDHHAVKFPVFQLVKSFVEGQKMLLRGVLGAMRGNHHQLQVDLQGRVAQQTAQLGLRGNFGRHQIQQNNLQGTDVLGLCPGLFHDENVLLVQNFRSRQIIGDLNGHALSSRLHLFQRLGNICDQILGIFQAAAQPDQIGAHARCFQFCVGHLPVGAGCRMQAAGPGVGNVGLDRAQLQVFHEVFCCFPAAV